MRKTYKVTIALCAVLIFVLSIFTVLSSADPLSISIGVGGASGAGLFGSMAASSGISVGFPSGTDPLQSDALWNDLNPGVTLDFKKGQKTDPDPVTQIPTVYDYIQIDLGDWLRAQNNYIDEFVSEYQVSDNDSGSISVSKSYAGYEFYNQVHIGSYDYLLGNVLGTVDGASTITLGRFQIVQGTGSNSSVTYAFYKDGSADGTTTTNSSTRGQTIFAGIRTTASPSNVVFFRYNGSAYNSLYTGGNSDFDDSYQATWSSGTVDTSVFDDWDNPTVKIPASSWSPSDPTNWNAAEFLHELTLKMLSGNQSDIIVEDAGSVPPVPPPVPVPTTPLGDIPTDEFYDILGLPLLEGQEDIHQDIVDFNTAVNEGFDDLGEQLDDTNDALDSIDTNIGVGNGLLSDIKTLAQTISSTLSNILQGVQDLVQEIVLSTETFIAGLLNSIMGGLGGWLSTMRDAFSIWHYVVEWMGSISTVFSWFWSMAGSASYYIQLPIYACLAGSVVLAFYKRFGR